MKFKVGLAVGLALGAGAALFEAVRSFAFDHALGRIAEWTEAGLTQGVTVLASLLLVLLICVCVRFVLVLLRAFLRTGLCVALLAVAAVLVSDKVPVGTNETNRAGAPACTVCQVDANPAQDGVGGDEVVAGWRVVSTRAQALEAAVFAMPTNAVAWDEALLGGAGYGTWCLPGGWRFPFNGPVWTNGFLWVEGVMRPRFDDRADEIRILDERLALCPAANWTRYRLAASRAWCITNAVGGLVATFENAALGDDPSQVVSAQLELNPVQGEIALRYDLRAAGDAVHAAGPVSDGVFRPVAVSSNTSEIVFRRVHPHDWDWDGLPDGIDDLPHVPRPEPVWGQSETWAALAFPNHAAEIAAAGGYLAWAAAQAAEPNRHLVGLEIVSPDNVWPVSVTFGGLQVMCNSTNTLYFAIDDGAKYAFKLSAGALSAVSVGNEDRVEQLWDDWYRPWTWCVWPTMVSVHMDSAKEGWIGRLPEVSVEGLGYSHFFPGDSLTVTAQVSNCHFNSYIGCEWFGGAGVVFSDSDSLLTTIACQTPGNANWASNHVYLVARFAGGLAVTNGYTVSCGPSSEPTLTLDISCSAVQFLNDGTNDYVRAERVYPVSVGLLAARGTEGRLSFLVDGTTDTCLFHDQEMTRPVQAGTDVSLGVSGSGGYLSGRTFYMSSSRLGRGRVWAVYTPTGDGMARTSSASFQVIEPIRKLVTTEEVGGEDERYVNPSRIVYGTNAVLKVSVNLAAGDTFTLTNDIFSCNGDNGRIVAQRREGNAWYATVEATTPTGTVDVVARFNGDRIQPRFKIPIVMPRSIPVRFFVVSPPAEQEDEDLEWTNPKLFAALESANRIYSQVGIRFFAAEEPTYLESPEDWAVAPGAYIRGRNGRPQWVYSQQCTNLLARYARNDCIEVYCVGRVLPPQGYAGMPWHSFFTEYGIIFAGPQNWQVDGSGEVVPLGDDSVLAHELGHALGLKDCYDYVIGGTNLIQIHGRDLPICGERFSLAEQDWGDETGWGFYERMDLLGTVMPQFLMYGSLSARKRDIPDDVFYSLKKDATSQRHYEFFKIGARGLHITNEKVFSK